MHRDEFDAVVVGAGPAGLTAAWKLAAAGARTAVFEAGDGVGGFSRSIDVFGGRVDLGPHRFFSRDRRVNDAWLEAIDGDYVMVDRVTRILYGGRLFDYPLRPSNAIAGLGPVEAFRSIASYTRARIAPPEDTASFETWVISRFGSRLYKIFFKTYSERLWGLPCAEIDADFAAQRIKKFSLGAALGAALRPSKRGQHKTLADRFAYPRDGAGAVYENMARQFEARGGVMRLRTPVAGVSIRDGRAVGVRLDSGDTVRARNVVSTMPLPLLVGAMKSVPDSVQRACAELRFRNTILVFSRVARGDLFPDQWIYVHDERVQMGRLTNFANWSPRVGGNPDGTTLCAEYWADDDDPLWRADGDIIERLVREDLAVSGLAADAPVTDVAIRRLARCYPVYRRGYRDHVEVVRRYVEGVENLHVIGRYGSFKYNNQDHSILMGLLVADNIAHGADHDTWSVNTDYDDYQEAALIDETGLVAA